jgi:hypothetical protein
MKLVRLPFQYHSSPSVSVRWLASSTRLPDQDSLVPAIAQTLRTATCTLHYSLRDEGTAKYRDGGDKTGTNHSNLARISIPIPANLIDTQLSAALREYGSHPSSRKNNRECCCVHRLSYRHSSVPKPQIDCGGRHPPLVACKDLTIS